MVRYPIVLFFMPLPLLLAIEHEEMLRALDPYLG